MLALERPFELFDMSSFREKVWGEMRERPHVKDSWSVPMKLLLKRAWTADVQERHKMANIERILRKECVACRDGNDSGLEHERRRSTFVFRNAKIPIDDDVLMGESNATNMTL